MSDIPATHRLERLDGGRLTFSATVVDVTHGDAPAVRLDQSAFYATGGGQPHDTGVLDGHRVVDVSSEDGVVVHHLQASARALPVVGSTVEGAVDGARRRDHRQQHSGQHVLSQAFVRTCDAPTVSFHLGPDHSTIDLAREVSDAEVAAAELCAQQCITDERPVQLHDVAEEELDRFDVRRITFRGARIRLVEFVGFETSTCGGTHVAHSGEIGGLVVLHTESIRGGSRIAFICGDRVAARLRDEHAVVRDLTRALSTGVDTLTARVQSLQESAREDARRAARWFDEVAAQRAMALGDAAPRIGTATLVSTCVDDLSEDEAVTLCRRLMTRPRTVALVARAGTERSRLWLARSSDLDAFAVGAWVKASAPPMVRGGGSPLQAQLVVQGDTSIEDALASCTAGVKAALEALA